MTYSPYLFYYPTPTDGNSTTSQPVHTRDAKYAGLSAGLVGAVLLLCLVYILAIGYRNPETSERARRQDDDIENHPRDPYGPLASAEGASRVTTWLAEHAEWKRRQQRQEQDHEQYEEQAEQPTSDSGAHKNSLQQATTSTGMGTMKKATSSKSMARRSSRRSSKTSHIAMVPLATRGSIARRPIPRPVPNQPVTQPVTMPTGPPPAPVTMLFSPQPRGVGPTSEQPSSSNSLQTTLVPSERTNASSNAMYHPVIELPIRTSTDDIEPLRLPPPVYHIDDRNLSRKKKTPRRNGTK